MRHSHNYLLNGSLVNNMIKMLFTRCKVHILYDIIQGVRIIGVSHSSLPAQSNLYLDSNAFQQSGIR